MIKRSLENVISSRFFKGKTIVLYGARQVGKTTLLNQISAKLTQKIIWLNGDNPEDRALISNINHTRAKELFPAGSLIFIDEAQRIANTGLNLKIIHDSCENVQIVVTGSSSFELTDKIKESMAGRKWTYKLYPLSFSELLSHTSFIESVRSLETRLIYGAYPEVINSPGNEKRALIEIVTDYLYKDIFALKDIRKPDAIENVLKALAFQVGNQVSYREISQITGLDKLTVERYIRLLEEAFVIFRLGSYAKNLRNELKFTRKIFFVDVGIRNAIIGNFAPLDLRNDVGALWENYLISERRKMIEYNGLYRNTYFWRTSRQQEIDYLEEYDGKLFAYEFKWRSNQKLKVSKTFTNSYPEAELKLINKENYFDFIK